MSRISSTRLASTKDIVPEYFFVLHLLLTVLFVIALNSNLWFLFLLYYAILCISYNFFFFKVVNNIEIVTFFFAKTVEIRMQTLDLAHKK